MGPLLDVALFLYRLPKIFANLLRPAMLRENRALTIQNNDQVTALSGREHGSPLCKKAFGLAPVHQINITVARPKLTQVLC
jgi:hypothetical protein